MATKTYQDFLNTVKPWMLDDSGRFRDPNAGVNYAAEGMTPQEFYDFQSQMVGDPNARDGADAGQRARGDVDASWQEGVVSTAKGPLGNWGIPLAMLAAPYVASQFGLGAADAGIGSSGEALAGNGFGIDAAVAPNSGMSLAEQYASYGAGGGGITGGLTTGTVGGFTGAAGGDFLVNGMPSNVASGGLSEWMKNNKTLTQLGGAAIGALANSKDTTQSATSTKDPWAPAQQYLLQNLADNQRSADYYRSNPFTNEQKAAYQGLLNTVAQAQAGGQGLLSNAANFMRSNRGVMPAMVASPTGVQAPAVDWSQYANIGRK